MPLRLQISSSFPRPCHHILDSVGHHNTRPFVYSTTSRRCNHIRNSNPNSRPPRHPQLSHSYHDLHPSLYQQRRQFHGTPRAHAKPHDTSNYYQILNLPPTAPQSDIKKAFYSLSKTHHPDRNPDDPTASDRFVAISDAYHVLGSATSRQKYDREHGLGAYAQSSSSAYGGPAGTSRPQGSYSSSGPAGGRPASGLSRRRTQFRGPPPSFYRSGGWGEQGEKRAKGAGEAEANARAQAQAEARSAEGGMGPGQNPFGNVNDMPHFDRDGHFRTQTKTEERRRKRTYDGDDGEYGQVQSILAQFLFISAILSFGVFVPSYLFERFTKKSKTERG